MSDEPGMDPEIEPENAHIRALLAELGSGPDGRPTPPEVAARLDDTLARLVAEREAGEPTSDEEDEGRGGTVVPLRRRWLQRTTAVAAAVIVVGAGGVAAAELGVFGNGASMSSDSGGASDAQVAESAPEPTADTPGSTPGSSGSSKSLTGEDTGGATGLDASALPQVSASSFASDVTLLLQRRTTAEKTDEAPTAGSDADSGTEGRSGGDTGADAGGTSQGLTTPEEARQSPGNARQSASCPGPTITDGAVPNPIRYDEHLAVLVIHPERDGRQLVEAWNCAGDTRLAETTITP